MIKTVGAAMLTAGLPLEVAKTTEDAALGGSHAMAAATPPVGATTPPITYVFFNPEEAAFIEAAVSRLIPADEQWPGALEAAVPNYMDKQLAGALGRGERLHRSGPWQQGTPTQGYQLRFTPAELFRTALAALNKELAQAGTPFSTMSPDQQDAYLRSLEAGGKDLDGVPSDDFFAALWAFTVEGLFSDPVYGGNRDMVAWRMIGFRGAYASYHALVGQHGITIDRTPMSLAEDAHGHIHSNPGIPAYSPPANTGTVKASAPRSPTSFTRHISSSATARSFSTLVVPN
jgi:gluconate 2-dehydrogenase gamma chain